MSQQPDSKPDIRQANDCPPCPVDASVWDKVIYWLGIGLGSGLPKRAPGTWGTLGGLVVALPMMALGFFPFLIITVLACMAGIYICGRTSKLMNVHDDPHIVWDEWAGMWIALFPVAFGYLAFGLFEYSFLQMKLGSSFVDITFMIGIATQFILFRFFDIFKPFPIDWLDKKLSGGLGIMLDDILAGLFSAIIGFIGLYLLIETFLKHFY